MSWSNTKNRHFAPLFTFFFCPIRERSWRPIFVSLQTRKWLLFSPLQQEHLFQGVINPENWHVGLATVQRRGWILRTNTLTRANGNERSEATSDQLVQFQPGFIFLPLSSARAQALTHQHTSSPVIAGYLHCNVMLHQLSCLPPLSPLCSFTGFPQHTTQRCASTNLLHQPLISY